MIEKMITSFDGTQLYMKSETAPDNKAIVLSILHMVMCVSIHLFHKCSLGAYWVPWGENTLGELIV